MRILSQDGKIDVNYDLVSLVICYKCKDGNGWFEIDMYSGSLSAKNVRMAKYSSAEKARKAMEMLHEQYAKLCSATTFLKGGMELFAESISQQEAEAFSMEYKNMNVFRFPSDDEVEV